MLILSAERMGWLGAIFGRRGDLTGDQADSRYDMGSLLLFLSATAIILLPFFTVGLPYRSSLYVQAGGIAAIVATVSICGLLRSGSIQALSRWWYQSPLFLIGIASYSCGSILAGYVGLARGNTTDLLAGQSLSLMLLPAGFVTVMVVDCTRPLRAICWGVLVATAAGSVIQLLYWVVSAQEGRWVARLLLPNKVSVSGTALLALLCVVALMKSRSARERRLAWFCGAPISALVVASGIRGLWIAVGASIAVFVALGNRKLPPGRWWTGASARVGAGILALIGALWMATAPTIRSNLLAATDIYSSVSEYPMAASSLDSDPHPSFTWLCGTERRGWVLSRTVSIQRGGIYRLAGRLSGFGRGVGYVGVQELDQSGEARRPILILRSRADLEVQRRRETLGYLGEGARIRLVAGCTSGTEGQWSLAEPSLVYLGSRGLLPLFRQSSLIRTRILSLLDPNDWDQSIGMRLEETMILLNRIRERGPLRTLFGEGLGATYEAPGSARAYGKKDSAPGLTRVNYIHNFYLFLLFKTGVLGTLLIGTALGLWLFGLVRRVRRIAVHLQQRLLAAVAAVFVGYLLWSVTSPQILDFRVAPVLGLVLGAVAQEFPEKPRHTSDQAT